MRRIGLLLALVLVGGCTSVDDRAEGPAGLELPARPRDVRIDGVEPCSLLTEQQRAELGLDGEPSSSKDQSALFGGEESVCLIRGYSPRAVAVGVGVVRTAGIELFSRGELDAQMSALSVQGYPAIRAVPRRYSKFCSVVVDVAAGQLLDIQYSDGGRQPPIVQEQLCLDADQVADAAMKTLLSG